MSNVKRDLGVGVGSALVCWLLLLYLGGWLGLSRAVSVGLGTLVTEQPVALVAAAASAAIFGFAAGVRGSGLVRPTAVALVANLAGAAMAVELVGELTVTEIPLSFVVLTALGLEPLALALGVVVGNIAVHRRHPRGSADG